MKTKINGIEYSLAVVRKDLLEEKLGVPVGEGYYYAADPLPYRWINEEFQVYYNGKWESAESIDFDFL